MADSKEYNLNVVNFGKGVRNKFHAHDSEQILIVTAGKGNYRHRERGKEALTQERMPKVLLKHIEKIANHIAGNIRRLTMKGLTEQDYRGFINDLSLLNKQKKFSRTFFSALKVSFMFKNIDEVLESKRKAFNFTLANIFKKWNLYHEELYSELNRIWKEVNVPTIFSRSFEIRSTKDDKVDPDCGKEEFRIKIPVLEPFGVKEAADKYIVTKKWEEYKSKAISFSKEFAKTKVTKENLV